jgi:hypothetical protein
MKSLAKLGVATMVVLAAFTVSPAKAAAQSDNQRLEKQELKAHQRQERALYGNGAVRQHERHERAQFKAQERAERSARFGGRYGGWHHGYRRPYSSGPYHNQNYPTWPHGRPRHGWGRH